MNETLKLSGETATVDADKYARLFSAAKTVFQKMENGDITLNIMHCDLTEPSWHLKVFEYGNIISSLAAALYAIDPKLAEQK